VPGLPEKMKLATFNRSGIRPLHQNCSFDNYRVENDGQMIALSRARQYVEEFDGNIHNIGDGDD
jgi:DNA replication protein DnaC